MLHDMAIARLEVALVDFASTACRDLEGLSWGEGEFVVQQTLVVNPGKDLGTL